MFLACTCARVIRCYDETVFISYIGPCLFNKVFHYSGILLCSLSFESHQVYTELRRYFHKIGTRCLCNNWFMAAICIHLYPSIKNREFMRHYSFTGVELGALVFMIIHRSTLQSFPLCTSVLTSMLCLPPAKVRWSPDTGKAPHKKLQIVKICRQQLLRCYMHVREYTSESKKNHTHLH